MYRLYIANSGGQYEKIVETTNVPMIIKMLDYFILARQFNTKYMVIKHTDRDSISLFNQGEIDKYKEWKIEVSSYRKVKRKENK